MGHRRRGSIGIAFLFCLAHVVAWADESPSALIERGKYLTLAGNCLGCHTTQAGEPFAGGVALQTPFGTIYSTNITPDHETGIGRWSEHEFARALHEGVRPDGQHLYPAFPYTAFTRVSDADVAAIYAYMRTVTPVKAAAPANELRFPYSQRWLLGMWKVMYFEPGRYRDDELRSRVWNRGAYLVEGLGHCGGCHTPRNFLGAESADAALAGGKYTHEVAGRLLEWSAPDLTSASTGLASWSVEELADYLQHGLSARAAVFGGMGDVILNSTRHLSTADVRAIVVYLKSLPPSARRPARPPDEDVRRSGALLYDIHCGTCHLPTGLGAPDTGPPLAGSPVVQASDPSSLINITLYGARMLHPQPSDAWRMRQWQVMEPFENKLSDQEVAALLTYVRSAWRNQADPVSDAQVARQRVTQ